MDDILLVQCRAVNASHSIRSSYVTQHIMYCTYTCVDLQFSTSENKEDNRKKYSSQKVNKLT